MKVSAWLSNIAFHLLCDGFGCKLWMWIMWSTQTHARLQLWLPEIVSKLLCSAIWSGCAVQLYTRFRKWYDSENEEMFQCLFLLRDQWIVEGLSEATNATLVDHKISLSPMLVHWKLISHEKKNNLFLQHLLLFSELFCLCLLVRPAKAELWQLLCLSADPRARPLILQSKLSIVFWNSLWEWLPDDLKRLDLGLKLELCLLTNEL